MKKSFSERFLEKMKNAKSKKVATTLKDKDGKKIKITYEDMERMGTHDVFMIACEVINEMPHDIYFTEDERYIENPVRYKVKSGEAVLLPHSRMIVSDDFNSQNIKFKLNYGDKKTRDYSTPAV